jgi:membrane protein implicated in regulation of membrane protease activity
MRLLVALLIAFAVAGFVSQAYAADEKPAAKKDDTKKAKNLKGEVVKIDGSAITVKVKDKSGTKDIVIATDDKTQVLIEGTPSKLSDLKVGQKVTVTPAEGTATKVVVPKPKEKKPAAK